MRKKKAYESKGQFLKGACDIWKLPQYKHLSNNSRTVYMWLRDRRDLSIANGWANSDGEVFVLYHNEELATDSCITRKTLLNTCIPSLEKVGLLRVDRDERSNIPNKYYVNDILPASENERKLKYKVSPNIHNRKQNKTAGIAVSEVSEKISIVREENSGVGEENSLVGVRNTPESYLKDSDLLKTDLNNKTYLKDCVLTKVRTLLNNGVLNINKKKYPLLIKTITGMDTKEIGSVEELSEEVLRKSLQFERIIEQLKVRDFTNESELEQFIEKVLSNEEQVVLLDGKEYQEDYMNWF